MLTMTAFFAVLAVVSFLGFGMEGLLLLAFAGVLLLSTGCFSEALLPLLVFSRLDCSLNNG